MILPFAGLRLATTFLAADSISPLARALGASALVPLAAARVLPVDGVLGWGRRPSSLRAQRAAIRMGVPFWSVEDGFLRSVGAGKTGMPSLSYLVDDTGIYLEAQSVSRMEYCIAHAALSAEDLDRAARLRAFITRHGLSKYCAPVAHRAAQPRFGRRSILLIDQTEGDASIAGACASAEDFRLMLSAARALAGTTDIFLRSHPDVVTGLARSALAGCGDLSGLPLAEGPIDEALARADEVWTVSSQAGFDALLRGKRVRTFGVPFYAGWGLTDDSAVSSNARAALHRRAATPRTVDELAHAALIACAVYLDPDTGRQLTPEQAAERLALWRDEAARIGQDHICVGFSRWKQPHARCYLGAGGGKQRFLTARQALKQVRAGDHVVAWGMKVGDDFARAMRDRRARFSRIEDGFMRSIGLGSNFLFPWSLCLDSNGIYYDARQASDLESLINSGRVDAASLARARELRRRIVALGVSKYNLGGGPPADLRARAAGRRVLLVVGQVPDDFSLKYGAAPFANNLAFLQAVRCDNPQAFIVYKKHPDIVSGNRRGASDRDEVSAFADHISREGDALKWIEACDEVHVMTSLAGFEAILREKTCICWGAPFYAGWGLTIDRIALTRRKHRPCIDELVARVLIDYTFYRKSCDIIPTTPEAILDSFVSAPDQGRSAGFSNVFAVRSFRFTQYIVAQAGAWTGRGRRKTLHPAAGARWPFFWSAPQLSEARGLQSDQDQFQRR